MNKLKNILEKNVDDSYNLNPELCKEIVWCKPSSKSDIKILGYIKNKKNQSRRIISSDGISPCLGAFTHGYAHGYLDDDEKIRRFTPKEFFYMMGLNDDEIKTIQDNNISETQQYKLAGNSIVVNVLVEIFENLF